MRGISSHSAERGFHVVRRVGDPASALHFAHATGFNGTTYRELFADLPPHIDVHAMDARGHGLSETPADWHRLRSWSRYAKDLERLVVRLGRPMVLAGHSMGGTVSLIVAAKRPELVRALVLIEPVLIEPALRLKMKAARCLGLTRRMPIAQAAARRTMVFDSRQAAVDNFVGKGAFESWPRSWIEAYVDGGVRDQPDGTVRLSCDRRWETRSFASGPPYVLGRLSKVNCPITLVVGRRGTTCSDRARDAFLKVAPKTQLLAREDASHFLPMEQPNLVAELLESAFDAP